MATPAAGLRAAPRTAGALALLTAALPFNLALTGAALLRGKALAQEVAAEPRTILISGGKMTKALQLARSFHAAGHRVILVEQAKYRLTGHRFSRAVSAFHTVPAPTDPGYAQALLRVVRREGVDVYVPVCSPAASLYDARARERLDPHCETIHLGEEMLARVDDKHHFTELARSLGLAAPDAERITDPQQVLDFPFEPGDQFILKSIPYDPVHRLDLTRVPCATPAQTEAFVRSLPISAERPWIMQRFVPGAEYCTHTTARDGAVQVYCCCASSAFQVNYANVDKPDIEAWVRAFVGRLGLTGQVSFDFIETADGRTFPIECNPRTHSAITMFYDHPGLAAAYLQDDAPPATPRPQSKPTYWLYHELWRLLADRDTRSLRTLRKGKDAIFAWEDPLPFLLVHHVQIPGLLLGNLLRGKPWIRVDFNIGKLVEPAGD